MKKIYPTITLLLTTLLLTACNNEDNSLAGIWVDTANSDATFLELKDDGSLSGSDGCNNLTGSWESNNDKINFSLLASTMMLCEDNNDWILQATTAEISNGNMKIQDLEQNTIGTLQKK